METLRTYYRLTKPGIVYGNVFHAAVGVLQADRMSLLAWNGAGLLIGMALLIASACVANNVMDRGIDKYMARTKKRAMVTQAVPIDHALLYSALLFTAGFVLLFQMTNLYTCVLGIIAYVWYVWIYGWAKRTTWHSTLIGTIPGALPIMAGYVAMTGMVDTTAWLLFAMLVFWQMPHFYAIAIYREKEYAAAKLPIATRVLGRRRVWRHMVVWTVLYVASLVWLTMHHTFHPIAGWLIVAAGIVWLVTVVRGAPEVTDVWARKVFGQSLLLTMLLLVSTAIGIVLP